MTKKITHKYYWEWRRHINRQWHDQAWWNFERDARTDALYTAMDDISTDLYCQDWRQMSVSERISRANEILEKTSEY